MIRKSLIENTIVYPDFKSSILGEYQYSIKEGVSSKSFVSCLIVCPAPTYRATYHRNNIIYKIFRICQGGPPPSQPRSLLTSLPAPNMMKIQDPLPLLPPHSPLFRLILYLKYLILNVSCGRGVC